MALQLLAHVDRLGGDESASPLATSGSPQFAVKLEEAFVVHVNVATFDKLGALLVPACEKLMADHASGAALDEDNAYIAVATMRTYAANLRRAVAAGAIPQPLPKAVADVCTLAVRMLDACSDVEGLGAAASAARSLYTISLGECAASTASTE